MKITHVNNELNLSHIQHRVQLRGWVSKSRRMGGMIFIDIRDRFGITQLTVDQHSAAYEQALLLRQEFVIHVSGIVVERQSKNPSLKTGEIEVQIDQLTIINTSETPPMLVLDETDALENTRLTYRYLDLRRPIQQNFLMMRSNITQTIRKVLVQEGFYELETPILGKSTPEGARDFLVPSRLYEQQFYALPQSPQIFKQLYMVAGFEKYFQIARCFRDEDLRADRQLEFTQVDIEASFVDQEDVIALIENIMTTLFLEILNVSIQTPFLRMPYDQAILTYGSDKPDMRFDLELKTLEATYKNNESPLLSLDHQAYILIDRVITRKEIDMLTETYKKHGGHILSYAKKEEDSFSGPLTKHFSNEQLQQLLSKNNDMIILATGSFNQVYEPLGAVRQQLGKILDLITPQTYKFLWVVDFPLFEYSEEDGRLYARHHPFTSPKNEDEMINQPLTAKANAYDIVLNGYEIGGGSIRIFKQELQQKMFEMLGLKKEEIVNRFGFFTEALKYGTPHGGIALGLDRLIMLMTNTENIKDVIAFPKTQSARDMMMDAPSTVDEKQLEEIHIKVKL
ncbi:MAG: aspartate--tRNA ligase [Firmicutes bacterium]|nr:aspartate--tRNA ligase [Bacillota bacterium]